ncbi:MAG: MG2 domain-containing protein [Candidatus Sumerlaeota bacterium]|nr:MG2 domain-containing protein [Candidatus Sumerlaeota bacterium]
MRVESLNISEFRVFGDWMSKQDYQVRITAGLVDQEGWELAQPVVRAFQAPQVAPLLRFNYAGRFYVPRQAGSVLAIESRNQSKVKAQIWRMFPSNIAVALRDMRDGEPGYQFNDRWAEKIDEKELTLESKGDAMATTPLDLATLLPSGRSGVFLLVVKSEDPEFEYLSASKLVLTTNIGALAQWRDEELALFTHDLFSLAPLAKAKVTVYSKKNQTCDEGVTDGQGLIHMTGFDVNKGEPKVAVIEAGDDYTFLELERRGEEDLGEAVWKLDPYDTKSYEAFLYADRELYRPGETAHLHWIVRRNHTETPSEVPLLVEILKPHGGTLLSQPTVLSKLGDGGLDLATQREYPTGRYRVRLLVPGNQKPLGEYLFFLEDFVPNRMKATVKIDNERPTLGETVGLTIHADHLFGAPAAGQRAEAEVVLDRGEFKPEKWADYHFGNDSQFEAQRIQCGEGQTDEKGDVTLHCELQAAKATFPLQASILGRVFELGGRAVTAKTDATVFPTTASLGLAAQAKPSGEVEVSVAAITPEEAPAALSAVTVTLERQTWNYYVRRYYNSNEANWSESFQEVESKEVPLVEGKGSASFAMHDYGYYRIRVHSDKTPQYSTLSFYSYGGRPQIVAEARPSLIKITLDKKEYQVGDEATARIESPFDGMGVVVLQGEAIQQVFPIDIKDGVAEATFLVGREQFPNGWVEVTVIHALEKDRAKVYPFSSFALANLRVVDREKQLTVTYPSFPQEIRPSQKFDVAIEVKDSKGQPAEAGLTLAAVDEGIHLMTGYESPDPFEWISRSRRPDLRRAQYYDKIAYLFDKPAPGGDGEEEAAKRINPPGENWIRNVALWVQDIHTDAQGKATVSLDVPEFTGQLRFVAVAFNDKALGARSDDLYVRRPYMMRASLPRFLSPADKFESRVVLYNQADRPVSAQLKWTSSGALEPEEGGKSLDVPAKGQADLRVNFAAGATTGQGEIRFQGAFRDASGKALETLVETDPIPVRPAAAYEARNELAILKPGESRTFDKGAFIDDARFEIELTAGASPLLRLQKALEYVVGYPYGCIEQTTSRLMPMYLLRKNRDLMDLTLKGGESIDNYIQSGISRLFSMQTPEGGLAFWPGAPEPYPYGSIYALHFLTLVKNGREYPLPEQSFKWLQEYVKQAGTRAPDNSPSSLYQRAYAAYVLALGGDADALRSIASFDNIELPAAARFMLAAALAQNTGDVARAKLFLTQTPTTPFEVREPDRTLNSDIRNDAVQLLAMLKLGEDKQAIADKANRLVSFLQNQSHGTTHETAFVVAALCEYLSSLNEDITKASATINASDDQPKEIQGAAMYSGIVKGAAASFAIANTGQADLYVNVTRRGIPTEPQAAASAGVAVARTVLTSGGGPVNGTTYKHADGYIVDLALKCDSEARNLIVSDLLPAGFEVENPRLDESVLKGVSLPAPATPSYVDVRDDHVIFAFAQLPAGLSHTYYVVRAVTPGQFQYPPAQAECMYDPSIHGSSEASEATVK